MRNFIQIAEFQSKELLNCHKIAINLQVSLISKAAKVLYKSNSCNTAFLGNSFSKQIYLNNVSLESYWLLKTLFPTFSVPGVALMTNFNLRFCNL